MLPHRVRWELGIGDREYATVVRLGRVFGHEDCVAENDTSRRAGISYSLFPFPAPAYALHHDPPASPVEAQAERATPGRGAFGPRLLDAPHHTAFASHLPPGPALRVDPPHTGPHPAAGPP